MREGSIRTDEQCKNSNLMAVSGYILQVLDDSFVIITEDGEQYLISYSPCTTAVSNIENYHLQPGDIVVLKG